MVLSSGSKNAASVQEITRPFSNGRSWQFKNCWMSNRTVNVRAIFHPMHGLLTTGILPGCMESLVFYKRLLLRRHEASMNSPQREVLVNDCVDLLARLQEVDPDRRQRYGDLGELSTSLSSLGSNTLRKHTALLNTHVLAYRNTMNTSLTLYRSQ